MKIFPLSEGAFTIDKTKLFIPFNLGADSMKERTAGSLLVEIQPFVVVTSRDVLLLDTGLGFEVDGELQLIQNLRKAGIDPNRITKVLMSHLHKDHAGGIAYDSAEGRRTLTFPNATYYVQRAEFEYVFEKGAPSYLPEEVEVLNHNDRVQWLEGDGKIDNYIRHEITGAHSKYHQVFWIEDEGETVFFGADDAPQLQQMKHRFAAKYDYDGKKAMELRSQWWQQAAEEKWKMLFYHDIKSPIGENV
ncbi:MAG: MBL fold metallo-hydrolase [Chitinophagaceae bacterium]|nr:MBL fold metallo-hydrolase [Chitinophagaceae bacterium]